MAQDVHRAIAEGLTQELAPLPDHQWIAYRPCGPNGDHDPPGAWTVELVTRPKTAAPEDYFTILHLTLQEDAIFTGVPRTGGTNTAAHVRFDYHDPQLIENIDRYIKAILASPGEPHWSRYTGSHH